MVPIPEIAAEFVDVALPDKRLSKRAAQIAESLGAAPGSSFPRLVGSVSELEALYRFFQNPAVSPKRLLEPHARCTAERCARQSVVRVAHDTSAFRYDGDREGLGPLGERGRGFYGHFALAIGPGEERVPLGVLGMHTFVRPEIRALSHKERNAICAATARKNKESARWASLVHEVEELLVHGTAVHVMDQEADDYALMAELIDKGARFVIRGSAERRLRYFAPDNVQDELNVSETSFLRRVALARRSAPKGRHSARDERDASLHVRSQSITLRRPNQAQSDTPLINVNVVQVFERNPPSGEEPVEWTLFTTETIATADDVAAVVDHYRARWRIEEFFRAVKSGCAVESRQLGSRESLERVLAMALPIAWRMLAMRVLSRGEQSPPATAMFDEADITVIRHLAARRRHAFPKEPTVRDAMLALANIGGHLKRNGDPGWITIGRGYDDYCAARQGYDAAIRALGRKK